MYVGHVSRVGSHKGKLEWQVDKPSLMPLLRNGIQGCLKINATELGWKAT